MFAKVNAGRNEKRDFSSGGRESLDCALLIIIPRDSSHVSYGGIIPNPDKLSHLTCVRTTPFLQLVSEFVILEIREEDEGSFYCSAANPAGVAAANFTLKVRELLESGGPEGGIEEETGLDSEEEEDMLKVRSAVYVCVLSRITCRGNFQKIPPRLSELCSIARPGRTQAEFAMRFLPWPGTIVHERSPFLRPVRRNLKMCVFLEFPR